MLSHDTSVANVRVLSKCNNKLYVKPMQLYDFTGLAEKDWKAPITQKGNHFSARFVKQMKTSVSTY